MSTTDTTTDTTTAPTMDEQVAAILAAMHAGTGESPAHDVAAILPTGTTARATAARNALATPVMSAAAVSPDHDVAAAIDILTTAFGIAAQAGGRQPAVVIPTDPADVLAAFATAAAFYAVTVGPVAISDRTPVGRFLAAARAIPATADAGSVLAAVIGRGSRTRQAGSGTRNVVPDGVRDVALLAALGNDALTYSGCTATVSQDDDTMSVTVRRGKKVVGTAGNLTAAARIANATDERPRGTSVNGWADAWVTADGRSADAVARGALTGASQ